jgi:hypothetical protein
MKNFYDHDPGADIVMDGVRWVFAILVIIAAGIVAFRGEPVQLAAILALAVFGMWVLDRPDANDAPDLPAPPAHPGKD